MSAETSSLEAIKEKIGIPEVWGALGLEGEPSNSCLSPFRPDKKESFSVYDHGRKWKDFTTGERGDLTDFIAKALNVNLSEAGRWLVLHEQGTTARKPLPRREPEQPRQKITLPRIDRGRNQDMLMLKKKRGLKNCDGIQKLIADGMLGFCYYPDAGQQVRSWLLYDRSHRCATVRRLDNKPWKDIGAKARTLKNSQARWPIGANLEGVDSVLFTEGAPDAVVAATLATEVRRKLWGRIGIVCMSGSFDIHPDALLSFQAKKVLVFAHADAAGLSAAARWHDQLVEAGADVQVVASENNDLDLNDSYKSQEIATVDTLI